jgi:ABC-2 type transport system permease protein
MKMLAIAVWGEMRKGLLVNWTYKANALIGLFTLGFIFVGVAFFMQGGAMEPAYMVTTLLGYLTWMYAALAVGDLSGGLSSEVHAGTLEQMAMSPVPLGIVLLGRVLANLLVTTLQVILMGMVMSLLFGLHIPLRWEVVPVLGVTWVGILGFGYVVAGAVLILKQVGSFANLLNNAFAFMNGSFLPVESMPGWLAGVSKALPSTLGVIVLRQVTLDGRELQDVWREGTLQALLIHSALYLTAGGLLFALCEKRARDRGSLGQY